MVTHGKGKILATAIGLATLACGFTSAAPASLPDPALDAPLAQTKGQDSIVLAGGCFWGVQAVFQSVKGVMQAVSGYAGGSAATAYYEYVGTGATGHAESVQVTYDPSQVTLGQILKIFFSVAHDPTQIDRQGPDRGTQYRSAIFFSSAEQKKIAEAYMEQLQHANVFAKPIATELAPLNAFYEAEAYHQNYARLHPDNPYIALNDLPKVSALEKEFPHLYKQP
ncbi:MAG: peptide-methionine (S)-S-oxide reductase MsrA [Alphaproteobacteria bacterium]|nr:peptide-methionine (S)-S-oxide reductase MsrA [Alphaproteobacteria bacterium]